MKTDFRLDLPDLETDEAELNISAYITTVQACVAKYKRWSVYSDKLILGFFSFGKYLMFHDLDRRSVAESANPLNHEILSALLSDGFGEEPSEIDDHSRLDDVLPITDMRTVLDADSSQLTAVVDVARGRNLVIQRPPGTGKSQTITNVIARAVLDGKTVLFVAEKMAALAVVKSRLERVGLGAACLELHSNKTNKRQLLTELERTWQLRSAVPTTPQADELEYKIQRKKLNDYIDVLHHPMGASGITPYYAMGTLVQYQDRSLKEAWPTFDVKIDWTRDQWVEYRALLSDLQAFVSEIGMPIRHPFWGCNITEQPAGRERDDLLAELQSAEQKLEVFQNRWTEALGSFGIQTGDGWDDVQACLAGLRMLAQAPDMRGVNVLGEEWKTSSAALTDIATVMHHIHELRNKHSETLLPDTWTKDLAGLRARLIQHQSSAFRFLSSEFRHARMEAISCLRNPVKQSVQDILGWMNDVIDVQASVQHVMREKDLLAKLLGSKWQSEESNMDECATVILWLVSFHQGLENGHVPVWALNLLQRPDIQNRAKDWLAELEQLLELARVAESQITDRLQYSPRKDAASEAQSNKGTAPNGTLRSTISEELECIRKWINEFDSLSGMVRWNLYVERCVNVGLKSVSDLIPEWEYAALSLVDAVTASWFEAMLRNEFKKHPNLAEFAANSQWNTVERFRALDAEMTSITQKLAAMAHIRRIPQREVNGGELGVLRREIQKKARHLPIRKLLEQAGHAVQGIKPVFMASPLSVATFVPPGSLHFDLVVFDEASQVLPVDAFGAILRGRQLVVVGDSKQLPPTNFFDVTLEDEDAEDADLRTGDMESILGLCVSQGMPERMLRWHYRRPSRVTRCRIQRRVLRWSASGLSKPKSNV